ncbi:MAG: stage V sporulation protein AD [Niameybacter sp.]|uniref:stage V sporulation protein AD n=1 Tax=Niameybacter sp. TaxID=2033640 RepID=UPI002FC65E1A
MGHVGKQTIVFDKQPVILDTFSTVGPKEGEGPMGGCFHEVAEDELFGEKTWEKAESILIKHTVTGLLNQSGKKPEEIDYILCGDLENQINSTQLAIKDFNIPFFGLYGACSTMGESMSLGAVLISAGYAKHVITGASSHYCTAEKQFRYPLEYGGQRPLTQQWTVTGSGYVLLGQSGAGPKIQSITTGKIVDFNTKDVYNMGAVMAPAAADTILTHLKDTNQKPEDYDAIITGDLGQCGRDILLDLTKQLGVDISKVHQDCGLLIFDNETQDTHAGGSGCGCSASLFAGHFYKALKEKKMKKILLVPTGALMSLCSTQQGENITGIAHAVSIVAE